MKLWPEHLSFGGAVEIEHIDILSLIVAKSFLCHNLLFLRRRRRSSGCGVPSGFSFASSAPNVRRGTRKGSKKTFLWERMSLVTSTGRAHIQPQVCEHRLKNKFGFILIFFTIHNLWHDYLYFMSTNETDAPVFQEQFFLDLFASRINPRN